MDNYDQTPAPFAPVLPEDLISDLKKLGKENSKNNFELADLVNGYIMEMRLDNNKPVLAQVYTEAGRAYGKASRTIRGICEGQRGYKRDTLLFYRDYLPAEMFTIARRLYNKQSEWDEAAQAQHIADGGLLCESPESILLIAFNGDDEGDGCCTVDKIISLYDAKVKDDNFGKVTRIFGELASLIPTQYRPKFDAITRTIRAWIK